VSGEARTQTIDCTAVWCSLEPQGKPDPSQACPQLPRHLRCSEHADSVPRKSYRIPLTAMKRLSGDQKNIEIQADSVPGT
jgi:hypothetical protein